MGYSSINDNSDDDDNDDDDVDDDDDFLNVQISDAS